MVVELVGRVTADDGGEVTKGRHKGRVGLADIGIALAIQSIVLGPSAGAADGHVPAHPLVVDVRSPCPGADYVVSRTMEINVRHRSAGSTVGGDLISTVAVHHHGSRASA